MKGLIIVNAYSQSTKELNQSKRLKEEFFKLGVDIDIRRNDFFGAYVDGDIVANVGEYSFCVYLDKDKYISKMLEQSGLKLFNSHNAIRLCDDKMSTHIALAGRGIPMPKTLAGLLCYTDNAIVEDEVYGRIERELGYPMVVKVNYGSLGKGVYLIGDRAELESTGQNLIHTPHLFQEYIKSSYGRDLRIIVIGGKAFSAMERISDGDFRSNIEIGGHGAPFELTPQYIELSEKIANELGLDYCGIDLLFGENSPVLCEVNSNAYFGGMEAISGKNVAKAYAEYILSKVNIL